MTETPLIAIDMARAQTGVLVLRRRGYAHKRREYADYLTTDEAAAYDNIIARFDKELAKKWRQAELKAHDNQHSSEGK